MKFAIRVPFVFLCFLLAGVLAQDIKPEFPVYLPLPTTDDPTTLVTSIMDATTEASTTSTAEEPAASTTPSTNEPTTSTTTKTEEPATLTTTTTEATTISTTAITPTTVALSTSTTQREPIYPPPQRPPSTTGKPTYTPENHWWYWNQQADRCYLKEQTEYYSTCYGWGRRTTINCYRCCYYEYNHISGCSKLHQGRCWWFS
ncbi:hypothetical protein KR009_007462 [Drosophila setifemur]|nr:hypothetical protein KR009_007462 [Drosophila setifemur]